MPSIHTLVAGLVAATLFHPAQAAASVNAVGAGGYDLVSYFKEGRAQRGSGHHAVAVGGVTYLFASDVNKKAFEAGPAGYLPQYGGYCAYGASIGKKFVADPEAYDIVDGKLYLNLDSKVRSLWRQDQAQRIKAGDIQWRAIAERSPSEL